MSPNPDISHWEGTWMQTSSFSFINDDLQIKPFGARSWHFPKQPVKSKGRSPACGDPEGASPLRWSWRFILAKLLTAPKQKMTSRHSIMIALWETASDFLGGDSYPPADVFASGHWKCGLIALRPLLAVGGPLGLPLLRAFHYGS